MPARKARAHRRAALTHGELIAGASALVLVILMFAAEWYSLAGIPGTSAHAQAVTTQTAWDAMQVVRWLMLPAILASLLAPAAHLLELSRSVIALLRLAVAFLGSATALMLTYRVLIAPPSSAEVVDQKLGAVLGVVCAYGIAIGGFGAIREQRARARGVIQTSSNPVASVANRR